MTNFFRPDRSHASRRWTFALLLCLCLAASGCGGGGGGQSSPPSPSPPPTPDFALSLSPASVSFQGGGSATTSLLATGSNGFSSQVSVSLSSLPSGVSISPSTITLTPGTAQQLTLSAKTGTAAGTATIAFTGASGTLSHSANLSLSITGTGGLQSFTTRTNYVRDDAVTEYYLWVNSHWVIYNQPTSRFFVTDPFSNTVFVFDSTTEKEIATIAVPGAYGIDQTADGSTLYVGTLVGDVYTLDPVAMKVTHRYIASQIGPYGFGGLIALPLSNGSVALLGEPGGIPSVDGSSNFAIWNPATNSIQVYGNLNYGLFNNGTPTSPICGGSSFPIFGFALTADRSSVLLGSGVKVCKMNASTGQYLSAQLAGYAVPIVLSPDGNDLAVLVPPNGVALYDPQTLGEVAQFTVPAAAGGSANLAFSADSKTLFVSTESIVYAYSVATHQQIGWFPNIFVGPTSGGLVVSPPDNPTYQVEDGSGLLVGPLEEGLGFLDTTQMQTGPVGTTFLNAFLNPNTGPVTGGTSSQWSMSSTTVGYPNGVFFGKNPATSFAVTSNQNISVITPSGNPGPVNVRLFMSDGGMQLVADGFSYGPTILEVTPNMATAGGGGAGVIYGYGFGPIGSSTIPSGLSVTVGGAPATITGYNPEAYGGNPHPYPLEAVYYTIPQGATGTADIKVTTASGSAVAKGALTYIATPNQYPLAGAALAQGIYDSYTDLYYFTDASKIQVFSLAQGAWLTPISVPVPAGATPRLWGISLSPDGTKLAVADIQANVIYLLDPASPSLVKTFPFSPTVPPGFIGHPAGVAVSDSGVVYIAAYMSGGTGLHSFYSLDTNSGTLTDYGIVGPQLSVDGVPQDPYLRTVLSSDSTRIYFNDDGYVFSIDTATDTLFNASNDVSCCYGDYDLALAPNQTRFEASEYLYDSDLNEQSFFTLNDRELRDISYVYGVKFSPDGSLLFQPSTNGIDVFDGRLGTLRDRIALPFSLSANYDALVSDGTDNVLLAITGSGDGIAAINLNALAEPAPLPYVAALSSRFQSAVRRARPAGAVPRAARVKRGIHPLKFGIRAVPHVVRRIFPHPARLRPRSP